jgi:hypothetical protein
MPRFLIFGLLIAIAVAWLAALFHRSGHAPVGLASVAVGVTLGVSLCILAAMLRIAGPRPLIPVIMVLAIVTILAQHAWLYANFQREWREVRESSPQVAMFRDESPWSPWEYIQREATPLRVTLWCADAALIMATTVATVWMMQRRALVNSASRPTPTNLTSDL